MAADAAGGEDALDDDQGEPSKPAYQDEGIIPAPSPQDDTSGVEAEEDDDAGKDKGNDRAGDNFGDAGLGEIYSLNGFCQRE